MLPFFTEALYFLLILALLASSGNLTLKIFRLNLKSSLETFLLSLLLPLILLSLLSYEFSMLSLQFLVGPFFWLFVSLGFFHGLYLFSERRKFIHFKFDWGLFSLAAVLSSLMSSITVRSGWLAKDGLEFFGVNTHDGLWHLALIGELKNHFPPQHPNFSGIELKGYHYFLDLLLAKFSQVFGFAETDLYFRFFPILTTILWFLATFLLARQYFQSKMVAYLTVFFSVLGGGFAYFLPLFHRGEVNLDSTFGVSSPISSLINLQFAFSIPVLALTFYAFAKFLKEKNFGWGLLAAIFTGSLFGFKIYAGVTVLFAIGLTSIFYLFKTKNLKIFWTPVLSGLLGLTVYLPASVGGAGLVFAPGETVQSIIRGPLSWTFWELQRQIYAQHYNFLGLAKIAIFAHLAFFFGNLGTKALGLGEILRFRQSSILRESFGLFSWAMILTFLIPPLFIQSITPFNIIQFWWYFLYLMSFLAAFFTWHFLKDKLALIKITSLAIIITLTVPAAFSVFVNYLSPKTSYKISPQKLAAIKFLKKISNTEDIVLEIPENTENLSFGLPQIPALGERRVFLGQEIIEFPYLDSQRRKDELKKIIKPLDCVPLKKNSCQKEVIASYEALVGNNIRYVFSPMSLFWLSENSKMSSLIYDRDGSYIYEIK